MSTLLLNITDRNINFTKKFLFVSCGDTSGPPAMKVSKRQKSTIKTIYFKSILKDFGMGYESRINWLLNKNFKPKRTRWILPQKKFLNFTLDQTSTNIRIQTRQPEILIIIPLLKATEKSVFSRMNNTLW